MMSIDFADATHGWATGYASEGSLSWSELLVTTDGGLTWQLKDPDVEWQREAVTGVLFTDATHGWLFADTAWSTADGGDTWKKMTGPRYVNDACLVDGVGMATGMDGFFATADLPGDSAAPVTFTDFDGRWHNGAVTVTVGAADIGGGAVASTEYRLDDQPGWRPVTGPMVFPAPSDHSGDGIHDLWLRSTDTSGIRETAQWRQVSIDTSRPVTRAPRKAVGVHDGKVRLPYLVLDATSPTARVVISVRRAGSKKIVARLPIDSAATNKLLKRTFICRLAPGKYVFTVQATDLAANSQSRVGSNVLLVMKRRG
jgi:hypothetical protein